MRRQIIFIAALTLLLTSCHRDAALRESAMSYVQAIAEYRIDDAKQYATDETVQNTLRVVEFYIMPILDSTYIEQNTPAKIHIDSIQHQSDTVAMVYYTKKTPIQKAHAQIEMRLQNGQWKAHQPIELPAMLKGRPAEFPTENISDAPMRRPTRQIPRIDSLQNR